jgi:hypothetical protein
MHCLPRKQWRYNSCPKGWLARWPRLQIPFESELSQFLDAFRERVFVPSSPSASLHSLESYEETRRLDSVLLLRRENCGT